MLDLSILGMVILAKPRNKRETGAERVHPDDFSRADHINMMAGLKMDLMRAGVERRTNWVFGPKFDFELVLKRGKFNEEEPFKITDIMLGEKDAITIRLIPTKPIEIITSNPPEVFVLGVIFLNELEAGNILPSQSED
jgi:hypothetical protein